MIKWFITFGSLLQQTANYCTWQKNALPQPHGLGRMSNRKVRLIDRMVRLIDRIVRLIDRMVRVIDKIVRLIDRMVRLIDRF